MGFGTGSFAKAVLTADSVTSLTIVELDPWQYRAAPWFDTAAALEDPRVEAITDDALHYIAHTEQTFDLVIIDSWGPEASQPIYTAEFHQRVRERLSARGFLWAKFSALTPESVVPVRDAVRCTYPYAVAVGSPREPAALIGSMIPPRQIAGMPRQVGLSADRSDCDPLSLSHPRRLRTRVQPDKRRDAP